MPDLAGFAKIITTFLLRHGPLSENLALQVRMTGT